jgi:anaerobic selenocysteine-containing dehydrogenase
MERNVTKREITRRTFLKLTASVTAVVAASNLLSKNRATSLVTRAKAAGLMAANDAWYPGLCKMCMQGDCQTRVHVVDGVVVKVEGDPRAIQNVGTLCPRGNAAIMQLYDPFRIKAPMKRTNPKKGLDVDPGFVEISWNEAVQTVAARLKKNMDDSRKVAAVSGFGVNSLFLGNFEAAFGKNPIQDTPARGSACAYHLGGYMSNQVGPDNVVDIERVEYILNVGRTLGPNIAVSSISTRHIMDALVNRGVKIVNVDPRCGPEASKMEWLPIRPGTESAFMLSILHTILYEIKTFDVWFVKNRTNAPYLIGADGDYVRDPKSNKPLMWNTKTNAAVAFDDPDTANLALEGSFTVNGAQVSPAFQLIKDAMNTYTPEWQVAITTVTAAKIREIANDLVTHAHIGATVTIDGVTMPFRPVSIQYEKGPYAHPIEGPYGDFAGKIIDELLGNLEVPGGQSGNSQPGKTWLQPDADGVRIPAGEPGTDYYGYKWTNPINFSDLRQFYPVAHTLVWGLPKFILQPEKYAAGAGFKLDTLLSFGGGPIRSSFDRGQFAQAWAAVPFHVVSTLVYDENAMLADIVLPDKPFLEKDGRYGGSSAPPGHKVAVEATRGGVYFLWRDASAITPVYNAQAMDEMLIDLAEATGILYGKTGMISKINASLAKAPLDLNKKFTIREYSEAFLKQNFGLDKKLSDMTDAHAPMLAYNTRGAKNYNYSYWPNNTTRHPMYFVMLPRVAARLKQNLQKSGLPGIPGWTNQEDYWKAFQPIPTWVPCHEFNAPADFDMWAINWKTPMGPFYCGNTYGNVWLHETMKTWDPYEYALWINSATAAKKGIKDGDTIVVESRYGKTQGLARVTELIHPEVIGFPAGHGAASSMANPITAEGGYFNALCNLDENNMALDPLTAQVEEGPAVKVYKA